ncbi:hypothetical protein HYT01_04295 [Candidatus Giovannonibacteria bacterium]|nr:hypothetical protein [Candidatus Giovannonibacteria bacterium]
MGFKVFRTAFGFAYMSSGVFGAAFGPENPLSTIFGAYEAYARLFLITIGVMMIFNIHARAAALGASIFFLAFAVKYNIYSLNYFIYLGGALALFFGAAIYFLLEGPGEYSFEKKAQNMISWRQGRKSH